MSTISRWFFHSLDRLASAFVTETVTADGTRVLLALDPSCHGLDLVVVISDDRNCDAWHVPDDLRSLT